MGFGRQQEEASTSSIGLIIAACVFAAAFIAAEVVVSPGASTDPGSVMQDARAAAALDLVIQDAGQTSTGLDWSTDPDHMTRFGLALNGSQNFLDYNKIKALRYGDMIADPTNGAPDYPEVRAALGITTGDVHLRTYPVLPTLGDPRWTKEPNGRIAYFAHYGGAASPAGIAASYDKTSSSLNVSETITNVGIAPAIYDALFKLCGSTASCNAIVTEERHTTLLQPGESQTIYANFWAEPSWDASIKGVDIALSDSYGSPAVDASGLTLPDAWIAQTPPIGSAGGGYLRLVSADNLYYATGQTVKFDVEQSTGTGGKIANAGGRFVLVGPNGKDWVNTSVTIPNKANQAYTYSCPNCTMLGQYTARIADNTSRPSIDVVYVSAATMFTEKSTVAPLATKEIGYLRDLVANFNPSRYGAATNPQGDVFGDDSNGPSDLTDVLSRYSTLVIGSEVTQTALTPSATKNGIATWVTNGGNLIVLGTVTQQSRWLEPIYQAAQTNANGGISAPDPTHAILTAPERLSYQRYSDNGRAWEIKSGQPFTNVLTRGSTGQSTDDTLAVSDAGALNNGTVVLTSYMPAALTSPQDDMEAERFLHNLLSQSYTMLFLDYGPPIPPGTPVGSDVRLAAVPHPNVPGAVVQVRVVLYDFG